MEKFILVDRCYLVYRYGLVNIVIDQMYESVTFLDTRTRTALCQCALCLRTTGQSINVLNILFPVLSLLN